MSSSSSSPTSRSASIMWGSRNDGSCRRGLALENALHAFQRDDAGHAIADRENVVRRQRLLAAVGLAMMHGQKAERRRQLLQRRLTERRLGALDRQFID